MTPTRLQIAEKRFAELFRRLESEHKKRLTTAYLLVPNPPPYSPYPYSLREVSTFGRY